MKRIIFAFSVVLLLFIVGCSNMDEKTPSTPVSEVVEEPLTLEPISEPNTLTVSDLNEILDNLVLSETTLTYHGKVENTCIASRAIRANHYIEKLQSFTWEECLPPDSWDGGYDYRCVITAPGVTLTAYRGSSESTRFLRVTTGSGVGVFTLSYITDKESGNAIQMNWMIFDTLMQWYDEAYTASLFGNTGTPLTAEELECFIDYTASEQSYYDETQGSYHVYSSEISCFFTSQYEDVSGLDFEDFMWYFPGDGIADTVSNAEFEMLKQVDVWPFKEVESPDSMPVPIHKYSRGEVDAVLIEYAGITTAKLDTSSVPYLAEYDAYYTYTSDYGPGMFRPCYGEKYDDIITLWEAPVGENNISDMLVLQKNGASWHILSYKSTAIS